MSISHDKLDKLEGLAHEAIRTAVGEVRGSTVPGRAKEAFNELKTAVVDVFADPATLLNLIREIRERR